MPTILYVCPIAYPVVPPRPLLCCTSQNGLSRVPRHVAVLRCVLVTLLPPDACMAQLLDSLGWKLKGPQLRDAATSPIDVQQKNLRESKMGRGDRRPRQSAMRGSRG